MTKYRVGQTGRVETGQYLGRYVFVEQDETRTGWHIFLLTDKPGRAPNDCWDIWADDLAQVEEWFDDPALCVTWLDDQDDS